MNETRYEYKDVPLSKEEAESMRQKEFEYMRDQVSELLKDMEKLCNSPLPTTHRVQVELKPGDDGYENASYAMNFVSYQGDVKWINQTASPTPRETE